MKIVLDAGAFVALERNDREMWARIIDARDVGDTLVTHGGIVGQVWRGRGPRQARLAKALTGVEVRPLDHAMGRAAGELMAASRTRDVVDAALVLLANDDDQILTSDPDDIERLARAAGIQIDLIEV